jgi:microcystin-dependent protein
LAAASTPDRRPPAPPRAAGEPRTVVTKVGPGFGSPPILGEIKMFAGTYAPSGYAFCLGQLLSIAQFASLYANLGTQYGGDGRQTFALPDLSHLERQQKVRYIIAVDGTFPPRQ